MSFHDEGVELNNFFVDERFYCDNCGKSYKLKNNLRRHQRVECGKEKTHVCHLCENKYYYKQELDMHLRMKHNILFRTVRYTQPIVRY